MTGVLAGLVGIAVFVFTRDQLDSKKWKTPAVRKLVSLIAAIMAAVLMGIIAGLFGTPRF